MVRLQPEDIPEEWSGWLTACERNRPIPMLPLCYQSRCRVSAKFLSMFFGLEKINKEQVLNSRPAIDNLALLEEGSGAEIIKPAE